VFHTVTSYPTFRNSHSRSKHTLKTMSLRIADESLTLNKLPLELKQMVFEELLAIIPLTEYAVCGLLFPNWRNIWRANFTRWLDTRSQGLSYEFSITRTTVRFLEENLESEFMDSYQTARSKSSIVALVAHYMSITCSASRTKGIRWWVTKGDGKLPFCPNSAECCYQQMVEIEDLRRSYIVVQEEDCILLWNRYWNETVLAELSLKSLRAVVSWSTAASAALTLGHGAGAWYLPDIFYSGTPSCTCIPCLRGEPKLFRHAPAYERVYPEDEDNWYAGATKAITTISSRGEPWLLCPCCPNRGDFLANTIWARWGEEGYMRNRYIRTRR
jgi:hypothetical protein